MREILIGDIGGTKTTLGFYRLSNYRFECIKQRTYCSHDYLQFQDLLKNFIALGARSEIKLMSLSIAGPVLNGECKTTNLPWTICAKEIESQFNIEQVILLNDIEATAWGLLNSNPEDLIQINPNAKIIAGHRAIISIGTGLGECYLFWDGQHYHPVATEGGHSNFAPHMPEDLELWAYLHQYYPKHISCERVMSGPGITLIYDYVCNKHGVINKAPDQHKNAWISSNAIQATDGICCESMAIFTRLIAVEAANLCLKTSANGGIYITGGIAAKIEPLLVHPSFIETFSNKGRLSDLLATLPIWVNRNEYTPLMGALEKARQVKKKTCFI
jgi:glucokinase